MSDYGFKYRCHCGEQAGEEGFEAVKVGSMSRHHDDGGASKDGGPQLGAQGSGRGEVPEAVEAAALDRADSLEMLLQCLRVHSPTPATH